MPADPELPPLNPFAAELRRAAAGAAAPDKAPSLRELSSISGLDRSAIGDWLAGKSLPRSWARQCDAGGRRDHQLAARYDKRFSDEEAVRQRCKDAYESAKSAQQANGISGSNAPVPGIDATAIPSEAASVRRKRAKYAVSAVAIFTILIATAALILLLHPTPLAGSVQAASGCLDRTGGTSWGAARSTCVPVAARVATPATPRTKKETATVCSGGSTGQQAGFLHPVGLPARWYHKVQFQRADGSVWGKECFP
jgi:hypothetical protein